MRSVRAGTFGAGEEIALVLEAQSAVNFEFIAQVERSFAHLMATALADRDAGLGGRLVYAGELDMDARALIVAANIAGAASLAASGDRAAQKQSVRDGIADFLVNSLDEALRILKNQLRKREAGAVCVGLAPDEVEREMAGRGVRPDLARDDVAALARTAGELGSATVIWRVASAPAQWLPKLDAIALACLDDDAWQSRRWLRLAPRYLGRAAQGVRLMRCEQAAAANFVEHVSRQMRNGTIGVPVEIRVKDAQGREDVREFALAGREPVR